MRAGPPPARLTEEYNRAMVTLRPFDMVEHLDSPEAIAECLRQVAAEGDAEEIARANEHVERAKARINQRDAIRAG